MNWISRISPRHDPDCYRARRHVRVDGHDAQACLDRHDDRSGCVRPTQYRQCGLLPSKWGAILSYPARGDHPHLTTLASWPIRDSHRCCREQRNHGDRAIHLGGDVVSLVAPVVELRAAQAARITAAINELGRQTWQISHQQAVGDRDSTMRLFSVALGGDYARVRAEVRLVGQGANAQQTARTSQTATKCMTFAPGRSTAPALTVTCCSGCREGHGAECLYRLIKSANTPQLASVSDQSQSHPVTWRLGPKRAESRNRDQRREVFARQHHRPDRRRPAFLQSRSVPPQVAERLVVLRFFDEVINRLPQSSFTDGLRAQVSAKLGTAQ